MTIEAILDLFVKNRKKIMAGGLVGLVVGLAWVNVVGGGYEGRVFVSLGAGWQQREQSPTSAWDTTEATEDFAETMMGILKAGKFNQFVSEGVSFDYKGCGVNTFEKGNLMLVCEAENEEQAQEVAEVALMSFDKVLQEYNEMTGAQYRIGHSNVSLAEMVSSDTKMGVAGLVLGVLLVWGVVLAVKVWRREVWHTSQVEVMLGGSVAELDEESLGKVGDKAFLGAKIGEGRKDILLPGEIDKFDAKRQSVVVVLGKVKVNDVKIVIEFLENETKVFTV